MVLTHVVNKHLNFNVGEEWPSLRIPTKPIAHRYDPKACEEPLIFTSKNDHRASLNTHFEII